LARHRQNISYLGREIALVERQSDPTNRNTDSAERRGTDSWLIRGRPPLPGSPEVVSATRPRRSLQSPDGMNGEDRDGSSRQTRPRRFMNQRRQNNSSSPPSWWDCPPWHGCPWPRGAMESIAPWRAGWPGSPRRRRKTISLIGALVLGLVAGFFVADWFVRRFDPQSAARRSSASSAYPHGQPAKPAETDRESGKGQVLVAGTPIPTWLETLHLLWPGRPEPGRRSGSRRSSKLSCGEATGPSSSIRTVPSSRASIFRATSCSIHSTSGRRPGASSTNCATSTTSSATRFRWYRRG